MTAQPQLQPPAPEPAPDRVLIVDDDASVLGVVTEVLEDDGYDVTNAATGEEAVELINANTFALVMTDIRLPGINGVSVLERTKENNARTRVIMITSHASLDTSIDAIKHGAYDYLLKPFEDLSLISSAAKRAVDAYNQDVERSQLIRSLELSNEELARVNKVLHGLAVRDGLTNLFNHRHINEQLDKEVEKAARLGTDLALIFVDVDKFKVFNDKYGHHSGDVILRELSTLMKGNVRSNDLVARWGGEEFVILCPQTDIATAQLLAETIRKIVAENQFIQSDLTGDIRITISAGVASFSSHKAKNLLVQAADTALYKAKHNGRNRVEISV